MLRHLMCILLALCIAFIGGTLSVYYSLRHFGGMDKIQIGQWTAYRQADSDDAYAAAKQGSSRDTVLGRAEGLSFTLIHDIEGKNLHGNCRYIVRGSVPEARFFTLYAISDKNYMPVKAADILPDKLFSQDIIRGENGIFTIILSPHAQEGNWLYVPQAPYALQLNLYDTPITSETGLTQFSMPDIIKLKEKDCG